MSQSGHPELVRHLQDRIQRDGGLCFSEFMRECLYHPRWGYYASGRAVIGRGGDFYTNVSVGKVYGEMLAVQFVEMWEKLGNPKSFWIMEQGAFNGQFATDVMDFIQQNSPECFECLNHGIVEPFEHFRNLQKEKLQKYSEKVTWFEAMEKISVDLDGVWFSNELVDSFPTDSVIFKNGKWMERRVDWVGDRFDFVLRDIENGEMVQKVHGLPQVENFSFEICSGIYPWVEKVSKVLKRGWVVTVDYGGLEEEFFTQERAGGTLRGFYEHRRVDDVLQNVGLQDLTASVNFTELMRVGEDLDLSTVGYADQHHVLVALMEVFAAGRELRADEIRKMKTLLHPELMGRAFKFLFQSKSLPTDLSLIGLKYAKKA
jgi:SAM-dependent MidA family methyltransferase